jgi:hypothetical protein
MRFLHHYTLALLFVFALRKAFAVRDKNKDEDPGLVLPAPLETVPTPVILAEVSLQADKDDKKKVAATITFTETEDGSSIAMMASAEDDDGLGLVNEVFAESYDPVLVYEKASKQKAPKKLKDAKEKVDKKKKEEKEHPTTYSMVPNDNAHDNAGGGPNRLRHRRHLDGCPYWRPEEPFSVCEWYNSFCEDYFLVQEKCQCFANLNDDHSHWEYAEELRSCVATLDNSIVYFYMHVWECDSSSCYWNYITSSRLTEYNYRCL